MLTIIVTGGIATGKSAFVTAYQRSLVGTVVFDSDACVHRLLTSPEVVRQIERTFGAPALDSQGRVSRPKLRDIVFGSDERRRLLEGILHPRVRQRCHEEKEMALGSGSCPVFLADVPLFFESHGFDIAHDEVVVVATSPEVQMRRLRARNQLSESMANAIISSQMPLPTKIDRADRVVWNDGTLDVLERQAAMLAAAHQLQSAPGTSPDA